MSDDAEAEKFVHAFSQLGYLIDDILEHEATNRLSTVRMISQGKPPMFVDLLFASSGIENEVVGSAEEVHIFSDVSVRVATVPSLIALKVLSARDSRLRDIVDLQGLFEVASNDDLDKARELMQLITARGYNRDKDLLADLEKYQRMASS